MTAAITLAREGYPVTVHEKEDSVGGLGKQHPDIHMTPIDFQKMKDYIGIDVEPCFSELKRFKAYIYSTKIVHFHPQHLYVTERGSHKSSLDHFLYQTAVDEGVNFEFSHPLTPEMIPTIPENSIIATGSYSTLFQPLKLRYTPFIHFDGFMKTQETDAFCLAYFDTNLAGYGYGYIAAKEGIASVELDFHSSQPYQTYLEEFKQLLKKTENLEVNSWSLIKDNIPEQIHLIKRIQKKTFIFAGAIGGFHDPFFGFGVNSALISGKIAATTIISKRKGMQEFNRFTPTLQRMFLLSKIYNLIPLKNIIIPRVFAGSKNSIPIIRGNLQSIPGFTHKDCFKIDHIEQEIKK